MTAQRKSQGTRISPQLRRQIARDRGQCGLLREKALTPGELAALKAIVQRRQALPADLNMEHAITALVNAEPSHHVARTLGALVADENESPAVRAVAAINLRLIPGPTAQRHLLDNLSTGDRRLRLHLIRSLGSFGDLEALTALRRLRPASDTPLGRQLAFAKALIAHRHGMPEPALEFRRGAKRSAGKPSEMIELSLRPKLKKTVRDDLARLRGSRFGIELGDRGFGLRAGRASWTVFVNQEIEAAGGLQQIFDRPWITALLARWDFQTRTSTVQYVVLTTPAPRSTEILVVRTDGEVLYSGRATRGQGLFGFEMRDIERPGTAPTNVKGRLTTRGVQLDLTVPFGLRRHSQVGDAVVV